MRSERQDLPTPDDASLNHSSVVLEELTKKINTNDHEGTDNSEEKDNDEEEDDDEEGE